MPAAMDPANLGLLHPNLLQQIFMAQLRALQQQRIPTVPSMADSLEVKKTPNSATATSTPIFNSYLPAPPESSMPAPVTPINSDSATARRRVRHGGSATKTAEVWKFFEQMPPPEQAASCNICKKTIKATNSSTTGMIRHLRSCHQKEHNQLQEARSRNQILKSINTLGPNSDEYTKQLRELFVSNKKNPLANDQVSPVSSANATVASSTCGTIQSAESDDRESNYSSSTNSGLFGYHMNEFANSLLKKDDAQAVDHLYNMPVKPEVRSAHEGQVNESDLYNCQHHIFKTGIRHEQELDEFDKADEVKENAPLGGHGRIYQEQNRVHKALSHHIALMLLLDKMPPSTVEKAGFRYLMRFLSPDYMIPSAADFHRLIMPEVEHALPADYMQQVTENNRFGTWPISPSTTVESGFEELENSHDVGKAHSFLYGLHAESQRGRKEDESSSSVDSFPIDNSH